jgi:hypothetical protein
MSERNAMRRALAAVALQSLLTLAIGCVDLTPLRERDFDRVTLEQLEASSETDESAVLEGVEGLIDRRLAEPGSVELDLVLEGLVALKTQRRVEAFDVVARCARSDPHEDARYVAVETLHTLAPERARDVLESIANTDASGLVRGHALEILEKKG